MARIDPSRGPVTNAPARSTGGVTGKPDPRAALEPQPAKRGWVSEARPQKSASTPQRSLSANLKDAARSTLQHLDAARKQLVGGPALRAHAEKEKALLVSHAGTDRAGFDHAEHELLMARNQVFDRGLSPPHLDLSRLSNEGLRSYHEAMRNQVMGHGASPALWQQTGQGGAWTVEEFQSTATELARRGQLGASDRFPLPTSTDGFATDHLRTAFINLSAAHLTQYGTTEPRAGTWLGDAVAAAKSKLTTEWSASPGVDLDRAFAAALEDLHRDRNSGAAQSALPGLDASFRAGQPLDLSGLDDTAVRGLHAMAAQQLPQAEFWLTQPEGSSGDVKQGRDFLAALKAAAEAEAGRRRLPL